MSRTYINSINLNKNVILLQFSESGVKPKYCWQKTFKSCSDLEKFIGQYEITLKKYVSNYPTCGNLGYLINLNYITNLQDLPKILKQLNILTN